MNSNLQLEDFSHQVHFPIHWGEMDAFQHLNNVTFFRYFETGRSHFFKEMMIERNTTGIAPILVNTSCQFMKQINFPDNIIVGTRLKGVGNTSFKLEHAIFSEKEGLAATGEAIIVMFDYGKNEKIAVSQEVLDMIK